MLLPVSLCKDDSEELITPNSLLYIGLHVPSQFFGDNHDGTSFEAVFGFHVNKHGNCL